MSSRRVKRRSSRRRVVRYIERALHVHEGIKADPELPLLHKNILRGRSDMNLMLMNGLNPFAFAAAWARVHGGEL